RGVAGTLVVEKIVGAAAESGADLTACAALGDRTARACASMGVALTSCTVPAAGKPTFQLGENEMELGVGIHGEPGRRRVPTAPADSVAGELTSAILHDLEPRKGAPRHCAGAAEVIRGSSVEAPSESVARSGRGPSSDPTSLPPEATGPAPPPLARARRTRPPCHRPRDGPRPVRGEGPDPGRDALRFRTTIASPRPARPWPRAPVRASPESCPAPRRGSAQALRR